MDARIDSTLQGDGADDALAKLKAALLSTPQTGGGRVRITPDGLVATHQTKLLDVRRDGQNGRDD